MLNSKPKMRVSDCVRMTRLIFDRHLAYTRTEFALELTLQNHVLTSQRGDITTDMSYILNLARLISHDRDLLSIINLSAMVQSHPLDPSLIDRVEQKYAEERDKRLAQHPEGEAQFVDLATSERFKHFVEDPWIDPSKKNAHSPALAPGDVQHCKCLIVGAGLGGLLHGVRLLDAGIPLNDILIVDSAGGFGGTWYWNRYPGLHCDVESYVYLPLLEETSYMPKHRYSHQTEIRGYIELMAKKWGLDQRAIFSEPTQRMTWDDKDTEWIVETGNLTIRSQFVILSGGILNRAKFPDLPGLESFKGDMFHTARWNYSITGGSGDDAEPAMFKLRDKRVGFIGTGSTAIQAIPELSKYAKRLYVFQRTPSGVDVRGQQRTNPEEWAAKIAFKRGWQRERQENFVEHVHHVHQPPKLDMVNDAWTQGDAAWYARVLATTDDPITAEGAREFVSHMHANDVARNQRIHRRVDETVRDQHTAEKLKHWYPTWCKRPCFSDSFLDCFNRPNVTLIDTDGKGIDMVKQNAVVVNGKSFDLDLLIFGTGFKSGATFKRGSAGARYNIEIVGVGGVSMDHVWPEGGVRTLHGLFKRAFPNLFFTGPVQSGLTVNDPFVLDIKATHTAYIISEALSRYVRKVKVEPTQEAQEDWATRVAAASAGKLVTRIGCTPSMFNGEGTLDKIIQNASPEQRLEMTKAGLWGKGILDYEAVLIDWRKEGNMRGVDIMECA